MPTTTNNDSNFRRSSAESYVSDVSFDESLNPLDIERLNNKRLSAIAKIDKAEFSWFHIRACIVSGVGFFTDAYDLFVIDLVSTMIGYAYGGWNRDIDVGLKTASSIGTIIGMVVFGHMADRYGRKKMYGVEVIIILGATVCSTLVGDSEAVSIYGSLIFWRIILGLGIGGDYPLSAIITSEFASAASRGAMMAVVFAMQGFGILTGALVSLAVVRIFKHSIIENPKNIDYAWRLVLALGIVPGVIALYFRLTIPETPRYAIETEQNAYVADMKAESPSKGRPVQQVRVSRMGFQKLTDKSNVTIKGFIKYFSVWENGKLLLAMCATWFCVDVCFYGLGMNNTLILSDIKFYTAIPSSNVTPEEMYTSLFHAALGTIVVTCIATIPGYWVAVFLIDRVGRKPIMWLGFAMSGIMLILIGVLFEKKTVFIALYALTRFFQNFGPNTVTFVMAGEIFPTRFRSTAYGICAGAGKLGAIVAQLGFTYLRDVNLNFYGTTNETHNFLGPLLAISSIFMAIGIGFTFLLPETKGKSLEELSTHPDDMEVRNRPQSTQKSR